MEASVKVELPTFTHDKKEKEYIKNVLYDIEFLKKQNIKEWQDEGGKECKNKCAIFTGGPVDRHHVIAMSKEQLVEKLTRLGVIEIVS